MIPSLDKTAAILSLVPGAEVSNNDGVVTWHKPSEPAVTEEEIQAECDRLQAEYDSQEYARKREAEYPSIEELVVAMYDDEDKAALINKRAAIKTKYPKG